MKIVKVILILLVLLALLYFAYIKLLKKEEINKPAVVETITTPVNKLQALKQNAGQLSSSSQVVKFGAFVQE